MYLLAGLFGTMALASLVVAGMSCWSGHRAVPRAVVRQRPRFAATAPSPVAATVLLPAGLPVVADAEAPWLDYDAANDQLLIIYDDSPDGVAPEVALVPCNTDPEITEIRLGGRLLASLATRGAPPLSAVFLVGESAAAALPPG